MKYNIKTEYKCPICLQPLYTDDKHLKSSPPQKTYICNGCGYNERRYMTRDYLLRLEFSNFTDINLLDKILYTIEYWINNSSHISDGGLLLNDIYGWIKLWKDVKDNK